MRGAGAQRYGLRRHAIAYAAAIGLLLRALLFPAGCEDAAAHEALADGAIPICTAHADGTAPLPDGPLKGSHKLPPCCVSAACCAAAVPPVFAAIEPRHAAKPAFVLDSWPVPDSASAFAPRNRGPPPSLSA